MNNRNRRRNRPSRLRAIEGELADVSPLSPHQELVSHQITFLLKLEQDGMDIKFYRQYFHPTTESLEDMVALLTSMVDELNDKRLEDMAVRAEYILEIHNVCKELALAEEEASEAVDKKKQAQLEIKDETRLSGKDKAILLRILEGYTSQLTGLTMDNEEEIAHFRETLLPTEAKAKKAVVVSLDKARERRKKGKGKK